MRASVKRTRRRCESSRSHSNLNSTQTPTDPESRTPNPNPNPNLSSHQIEIEPFCERLKEYRPRFSCRVARSGPPGSATMRELFPGDDESTGSPLGLRSSGRLSSPAGRRTGR